MGKASRTKRERLTAKIADTGSPEAARAALHTDKTNKRLNYLASTGTAPLPVRNKQGEIVKLIDRFSPEIRRIVMARKPKVEETTG